MAGIDGLEKILGIVVNTIDDVGESLGVGSPEDNDLVKTVDRLEVAAKD